MLTDRAIAEASDAKFCRLRCWWAAWGLLLVAVTWRLWTLQEVFPQVPLIRWVGSLPAAAEWLILGALLTALTVACVDRTARLCWWMVAGSLGALILMNQHRLQPWAWQLLLLSIAFTALPRTISALRWLTISIYVWSAVSKLDATFFATHGQTLVEALSSSVGFDAGDWPASLRWWLAALLPVGEFLIGAGLGWQKTRQAAVWAAIGLHAALLLALGPLGLRHRPGVLLWNMAFIGHDWLLFLRIDPAAPPNRGSLGVPAKVRTTMILAAGVWPVVEPWGLCDHWLAWGVYSTRTERLDVVLTDEGVRRLPESARRLVVDNELRLDRWSLESLNVPIYPQLRFQVGVIDAVRRRCGDEHVLEVVLLRPGHRLDSRPQIERLTTAQIDERRAKFWCNSQVRSG